MATPRAQGFVDSITHGENGLMWKPNNTEDAVRTLAAIRDDDDLRARLDNGARKAVENLSCSTTVRDLLQWYAASASIRRGVTFPLVRLFMTSVLLGVGCIADLTVIEMARSYLERFADKQERARASSL